MAEQGKLPYRAVAICGYRQRGRELYQKLLGEGIEIPYIIERNYQALAVLEAGLGTEIVGFQKPADYYRRAEAILLSGDLPEGIVREALELAGIEVPVITSMEEI